MDCHHLIQKIRKAMRPSCNGLAPTPLKRGREREKVKKRHNTHIKKHIGETKKTKHKTLRCGDGIGRAERILAQLGSITAGNRGEKREEREG